MKYNILYIVILIPFIIHAQVFEPVANHGISPGRISSNFETGDINADGFQDLIFSRPDGDSSVAIFCRNSGHNTFTQTTLNHVHSGSQIKLADFDQDGFLDLLKIGLEVVYSDGRNKVRARKTKIYKNQNGNDFIRDEESIINSFSTGDINIEDYNNDGYPEITLQGFSSNNYWSPHSELVFNDAGILSYSNSMDLLPIYGGGVVFINYDSDDQKDILVYGRDTYQDPVVKACITDGNNIRVEQANLFNKAPKYITKGDLNEDGLEDLIAVNYFQDEFEIILFTKELDGDFRRIKIFEGNQFNIDQIVVGKFNGDNFNDLAISGTDTEDHGKLMILTNDGALNFRDKSINIIPLQSQHFEFFDINNDEVLDMVMRGYKYGIGDTLMVYINTDDTKTFTSNNISQNSTVLYPNPIVGDEITIQSNLFDCTKKTIISMMDINGRIIDQKSGLFCQAKAIYRLKPELSRGTYFFSIQQGEHTETIKTVIQ